MHSWSETPVFFHFRSRQKNSSLDCDFENESYLNDSNFSQIFLKSVLLNTLWKSSLLFLLCFLSKSTKRILETIFTIKRRGSFSLLLVLHCNERHSSVLCWATLISTYQNQKSWPLKNLFFEKSLLAMFKIYCLHPQRLLHPWHKILEKALHPVFNFFSRTEI